jgi:hypothetical protein
MVALLRVCENIIVMFWLQKYLLGEMVLFYQGIALLIGCDVQLLINFMD